jgi:hypothetical protein
VDVVTDSAEFPETSGIVASSAPSNVLRLSVNLKIDKFKGDNTQNVDTWLSMYKQYWSFYDLSDKKSADSFPFHQIMFKIPFNKDILIKVIDIAERLS